MCKGIDFLEDWKADVPEDPKEEPLVPLECYGDLFWEPVTEEEEAFYHEYSDGVPPCCL